ncbi:MAG TPA: hypothetical protein VD706_00740 [Candidatus Saccharimonadales bacterium]|nr:hypothetical protein [Candidatus Saccharimonadales bacterium]
MSFLTRLIKKPHFWRISGLLLADLLVFGNTNPNNSLSIMLIIGYILFCTTMYYLLDAVLSLSRLYGVRFKHKKRFLRSAIVLISGLVALQSIGQLSSRDLMVLAPLSVLLYLYIAYIRSGRQRVAARRGEL